MNKYELWLNNKGLLVPKDLVDFAKIFSNISIEDPLSFIEQEMVSAEKEERLVTSLDWCFTAISYSCAKKDEEYYRFLKKYSVLLCRLAERDYSENKYVENLKSLPVEDINIHNPTILGVLKLFLKTDVIRYYYNPKKIVVILERMRLPKPLYESSDLESIQRRVRDDYDEKKQRLIVTTKYFLNNANNISEVVAEKENVIKQLQNYFNSYAFENEKILENECCKLLRDLSSDINIKQINKIHEKVTEITNEISREPTENACCFLVPILAKLFGIVDVIRNSCRTEITIEKIYKHYPFHKLDFDHEISIPTKNTGNSTIHDLCILIEVDKEIVGKVELSDPIHSDEMSPDTTSDIHFGIRTKEKFRTPDIPPPEFVRFSASRHSLMHPETHL